MSCASSILDFENTISHKMWSVEEAQKSSSCSPYISITYLRIHSVALLYIHSVFYAINWIHKLAGFENVNPSIAEASSRISRKPVRKAEPMTPEILGLLFKQYAESDNFYTSVT